MAQTGWVGGAQAKEDLGSYFCQFCMIGLSFRLHGLGSGLGLGLQLRLGLGLELGLGWD